MVKSDLIHEINELKKRKNAVILAHYYQSPEIQEIADFVGDSYKLSVEASRTKAAIIVFAGVYFMAETAKILNPEKKVLVPDTNAGCSLADSCEYEVFKSFIEKHPEHVVVTYVNCSAEIKSLSDITCTSSNAEQIIKSISPGKPIIFAPDRNLGKYLALKTKREMLLWDGVCVVHEAFSLEKLMRIYDEYPDAKIIAHPESHPDVLTAAHFIGATSELVRYVDESPSQNFIVATEAGILHKMKLLSPSKNLIPAPVYEENTCSCSECAFMKLNTLEKIYRCLVNEEPFITLSDTILDQARRPLDRMIRITENYGKV